MINIMRVEIYSLKHVLFQGEAEAVNCKTMKGEITILERHEPLISMLAEGPIKVTPPGGGKEEIFSIKGGFLEIGPAHGVRLLVEE